MTLRRRLDFLERQTRERETRQQCERLAKEFEVPFQEVWEETKRIGKELERYERMGMTLEQALRRYAEGEGLDPDEMVAEYEGISAEYEKEAEVYPKGDVAE